MGKIFIFILLSNQIEFCFIDVLKPSNDRSEFQLEGFLARCHKNIAENLFALGHETDIRTRKFSILLCRRQMPPNPYYIWLCILMHKKTLLSNNSLVICYDFGGFCNVLLNQAQTHHDHLKVLDEGALLESVRRIKLTLP